ncbi:unnamed protein product [Sphenostylis stenocarpa]|uniref:Uncharacterized protein n=1 Tax=Sphenostylis stenocarpa TaxID=92480 RepID=A0AA86SC05_9FABA|nr:unnamed protein product [Sphenostylis stenocarpa]
MDRNSNVVSTPKCSLHTERCGGSQPIVRMVTRAKCPARSTLSKSSWIQWHRKQATCAAARALHCKIRKPKAFGGFLTVEGRAQQLGFHA